jgi:hypothetical protein
VNALTDDSLTAVVEDVRCSAGNFAIALWGEILYGNPNYHIGGHVMSLSQTILNLAGSPWPSIWYSLARILHLVTPGQPTLSEAKIRARVAEVVDGSVKKLEKFEHNNPDAPLRTIRVISVKTGGGRTGPLSNFASEFTNLNVFG